MEEMRNELDINKKTLVGTLRQTMRLLGRDGGNALVVISLNDGYTYDVKRFNGGKLVHTARRSLTVPALLKWLNKESHDDPIFQVKQSSGNKLLLKLVDKDLIPILKRLGPENLYSFVEIEY